MIAKNRNLAAEMIVSELAKTVNAFCKEKENPQHPLIPKKSDWQP